MSEAEKETLQIVAEHLVLALRPLCDGMTDLASFQSLLLDLGWNSQNLPQDYVALARLVASTLDSLDGSPGVLLAKAQEIYKALVKIDKAPDGISDYPQAAAQFLAELPGRVFELLLVRYLASVTPALYSLLEALGIVGYDQFDGDKASKRPAVLIPRLYYEAIPEVLADPVGMLQAMCAWGASLLDFEMFVRLLADFSRSVGVPASMEWVSGDVARGYRSTISAAAPPEKMLVIPLGDMAIDGKAAGAGLALLPLQGTDGKSGGLIVQPMLPKAPQTKFELLEGLELVLQGKIDANDLFGVVLRPGEIEVKYPLKAGAQLPDAGFSALLAYASGPGKERTLLGHPKRSRLQLGGASIGLECTMRGGEPAELALKLATKELAAIISPADLDGFFQTLLGGSDLKIDSPFELGWSNRTGFSFQGGPGLEITAHPHLELGPVTISQYQVRLRSTLGGKDPDLMLEGGLNLNCKLGPLAASVEGMGVHVLMAFRQGNAGPFNIEGGFKPPTGLGIVVDAGPVTGGGFLSFDEANGRYSGVLQLQIYEVAVKAIGLLDTKLPGGESGFSFLIIITAEFSPIQLGFGFTLNGVGGLAGIHRTIVTDEIQKGIRSGTIDHILFPKNPVANAARLISDLRRIFPPAKDHYIFGPMAIIGWGTPTLITAEVGIILELPDPVRLVLLGEVGACLPDKENTLVELHVSVFGSLDFGRKLLAIDASLHDSRILAFSLYGDMALRLSWGTPPAFAFSLGGLHPQFQPPPGFPKLRRLTIALCTGDNPRLSLQAYMALTSNTVQFGARAEVYVDVGVFDLNVHGFVGFDVLVQFSPFSFVAGLAAMISVRTGKTVLFGVWLEATLSGPTPWHVWGKAIFTFIGIPIPVHFDTTFGPARRPEPLPRGEPWTKLKEAIADPRNWSASSPASERPVVSLAQPEGDGAGVVLDPMGQATFRQKVVPLNRKITRFGNTQPEGPDRYDLSAVEVGTDPNLPWSTVQDHFAPAQFEEMSDAQKLSRPSFEKMDAGVSIGSEAVAPGKSVSKDLVYETIVLDAPWRKVPQADAYELKRDRQMAMTGLGAAARSQIRTTGNERYMPPAAASAAVALDDEQYVIASTADLSRLQVDANQPTSKGAAFQMLADLITADPAARDRWQVVPTYELGETS